MKMLTLLFVLASYAMAQATHSATLTWTDDMNPVGTTYNVKRALGLCTGNPVLSGMVTGLTVKTYTDNTVTPGNYCYTVSATFNGMESLNATPVMASVPAFSPVGLMVTVK